MRALLVGVLALGCGAPTPATGTSSTTTEAGSSVGTGSTTEGASADTTGLASGTDTTSTGGELPASCVLAGVTGTCIDVLQCPGDDLALLAICDDVPSIECCLPDAIACSVAGAPGLCLPTAACPADHDVTPGRCPGDADVQCCSDPSRACDETAMPVPDQGLVEISYDSRCPDGMIAIAEAYCIDRHEAALVRADGSGSFSPFWNPGDTAVRAVSIAGAVPQGYIDADRAEAACNAAGKRLCSDDEWLRACQGAAMHTYPYGDTPIAGACNDARARHPAVEYFGSSDAWIWSELGNPCIGQVPDGLQVTGAHPACVSDDGALDMVGNLHEWTADPDGTFRGGFYVDTVLNGPGCLYATVAHDRTHWDYSTGFRCCAALR